MKILKILPHKIFGLNRYSQKYQSISNQEGKKMIKLFLLFVLLTSAQAQAQVFKKLKDKVNESLEIESKTDDQKNQEDINGLNAVSNRMDIEKSPQKDIDRNISQLKRGYDGTIENNSKWCVDKGTEDVLKLFNGYAYKKGFNEVKTEVYAGPLFNNKQPNGTQDKYMCYYYNGIGNRRMGATMYFSTAYVFNKFWNDTSNHFIVPITWNVPAGHVPARFLGEAQGTAQEYRNSIIKECGDPDNEVYLYIYQMKFMSYEDYILACKDLHEKALIESKNYQMKSIEDAMYYDFYYGKNGKTKVMYSEDVIKKNGDNWPLETLEQFIDIFSYSKHVNSFVSRILESKNSIESIVYVIKKYPTVPYDKIIMENKLIGLSKNMSDIRMIKGVSAFSSSKKLEAKAIELIKSTNSLVDVEICLSLYSSGTANAEALRAKENILAKIQKEREDRMKHEGPGGIDLIDGPYWSGLSKVWQITYFDKSKTEISYNSRFGLLTDLLPVGCSFESASFIVNNKKYIFEDVSNAAKAKYDLLKGKSTYNTKGLIEVIDLELRAIEEKSGFVISAANVNDCEVKRDVNNYGVSVAIHDCGLFTSNLASDSYYVTCTNKNGDITFTNNDPFKDNGFDAIRIGQYDLPVTISIAYKPDGRSEMKFVSVLLKEIGNYTVSIH